MAIRTGVTKANRRELNVSLEWRGEIITAEISRAVREAMRETLDDAVSEAKAFAPVDTGALRDSIRHTGVRSREGSSIIYGRWGSYDIHYAIFQEFGTINHSAHPFIRPAAQIAYPRLAERIRRNLRHV